NQSPHVSMVKACPSVEDQWYATTVGDSRSPRDVEHHREMRASMDVADCRGEAINAGRLDEVDGSADGSQGHLVTCPGPILVTTNRLEFPFDRCTMLPGTLNDGP